MRTRRGVSLVQAFVGLLRSIDVAQFDRHPPFHSRLLVFRAATVAPPCLGRSHCQIWGIPLVLADSEGRFRQQRKGSTGYGPQVA